MKKKVYCVIPLGYSCPLQNELGSKIVLFGVVIVGSYALTKMSQELEVRLYVCVSLNLLEEMFTYDIRNVRK